ncbi:phytochelatin synthase family protein [uncultured Thiodictyon sp.]|uniref:phytochelatin synthase family protein n=1 Tax=uncultured Thiodictyon sp. TaxID=1846217 RepID=UPI0025F44CCA|nr:phytochelatin synthase family protein [uncultured Thiodictyon sp.]
MYSFSKPIRVRWIVAVMVLTLTGIGGAWQFARSLSQPHPERYAPGVLYGGIAQQQLLSRPVAREYLSTFHTQETLSSCGPSSVLNVLNSLGIPIANENALFDSNAWGWLSVRLQGITLDDLASLVAERHIGEVTVLRDLSYEAFLDHLKRSNNLDNRYIVNFDRKPIFGVPVGHFSPIGGYDENSDLVAILDVTPGYGPSLVPSKLLYDAVQTTDSATGRSRGLIHISNLTGMAGRKDVRR